MSGKVTDAEFEDFKAKWALEYSEWERIRDEVIAKDGDGSAYDVTAEQARRMRERGETSVLLGPVAKALGLTPHVVLYPVADPPEVKISRTVKEVLMGRSVAELRAIRDACDKAIAEAPPAGGCFVPGCTGPCEGEPDRPQKAAPADAPVRCRIGWSHGKWRCGSSGCGASGDVIHWRLVDQRGITISVDDLPAQRQPYDPAETCLFDRPRKP
jgi:hypothetical protein